MVIIGVIERLSHLGKHKSESIKSEPAKTSTYKIYEEATGEKKNKPFELSESTHNAAERHRQRMRDESAKKFMDNINKKVEERSNIKEEKPKHITEVREKPKTTIINKEYHYNGTGGAAGSGKGKAKLGKTSRAVSGNPGKFVDVNDRVANASFNQLNNLKDLDRRMSRF